MALLQKMVSEYALETFSTPKGVEMKSVLFLAIIQFLLLFVPMHAYPAEVKIAANMCGFDFPNLEYDRKRCSVHRQPILSCFPLLIECP